MPRCVWHRRYSTDFSGTTRSMVRNAFSLFLFPFSLFSFLVSLFYFFISFLVPSLSLSLLFPIRNLSPSLLSRTALPIGEAVSLLLPDVCFVLRIRWGDDWLTVQWVWAHCKGHPKWLHAVCKLCMYMGWWPARNYAVVVPS